MSSKRVFLTALGCLLLLAAPAVAQDATTDSQPVADSALRIEDLLDKTAEDPSDAAAWTRLGILYIDEEMYEEARDAFISALQAAPQEPSSHLNLAVGLIRMEKWEDALTPLATYRTMKPDDARGYALAAQALAATGDTDGAVGLWMEGSANPQIPVKDRTRMVLDATTALLHQDDKNTDPDDSELARTGEILEKRAKLVNSPDAKELRVRRDFVWLELARRHRDADEIDAALDAWATLRAAGTRNPAAWMQPVQLLIDEGRTDEAAELVADAAETIPSSASVDFLEGRIAQQRGDFRAAVKAFKEAARRDPDLPGIWPALGEVLAKTGDHAGASNALAEAVRRGQGGATAAFNMGVVLNKKNRYAEAIPFLEDATKADPQNRDAFRALGTAYRKQKKYTQAEATYQTVVDEFGPEIQDLYQLAFCEAKCGDHAPASIHYEMVTALQPDNVNAFYGLGNALSKQGKYEDAGRAYKSALELKPDFYGASFAWALALQKMGDYDGAIERYELTLEIRETYSAYVNMAICYQNLGDEESSNEFYALANEIKKKGR